MFTTQELVCHAGETEYVVADVRSGSIQPLATRISRCGRMDRGRVIRYPWLRHVRMRQAEIQHAHFAPRRDHHVAGLQIHVQDTTRVRVRYGIAEVAQDGERRLARQLAGPDALDQVAQQLSLEQFHRDEIHVAVAIEVEDVDDAGMGQRLRLVRLAAQCLQRIGSTCEFLEQHLDGHVTILRRKVLPVAVQCPINGAHAAAAEFLLEHVPLTQYGPQAHGGTGGEMGDLAGIPRR